MGRVEVRKEGKWRKITIVTGIREEILIMITTRADTITFKFSRYPPEHLVINWYNHRICS
jgi:hypothetical protein